MGARLRSRPVDVKKSDRRLIGRSEPADDLQVVRTEGSWVIDSEGRRHVDFLSGWCVGNLGWSNREIREPLRRFDGPDYVSPSALYAPWVECAARLAAATPGRLRTCFRATTGTESVELALQIARCATGRKKLVQLEGAYHGNSIGVKDIHHELAPPLDERALGRLETLLKHRDVAAFIMEPVVSALGVLVPHHEFMTGAQELCRRFGTLFVMDEVAVGFGRTGRMFASEHFDIEPDVMCLAKALTSGYAPMGATITTEEIAREVAGELDFYATFGWHPIGVEAALATLRYFERHGAALFRNVAARSADFALRLAAMPFAPGHEIRVVGLAIGIALAGDDDADAIGERCREEGLLLATEEDTLLLFPALTIDRDTAHAGLDILEACLAG
jgi:4-aminobutyrate aminotransferase-like enzyme